MSTAAVEILVSPAASVEAPTSLIDTTRRSIAAEFARRPAIVAAGAFMAGIVLHTAAPHRPVVWLALLGALVAASWWGTSIRAIAWLRSNTLQSILIALGLTVAGSCAAQLSAFYYPRNHISAFATDRPRLATMELNIVAPPRVLTNRFEENRPLPPKQGTTAHVTRVLTWDGWRPATGEVLVQVTQPHARLAMGQEIRVTGMLQRPSPAVNPGQFDWAAYYRGQRTLASIQIAQAHNIELLADPGPGVLGAVRERVRELLADGFDPDASLDHALLRALLLGDHDPELRDVQEQFRRTGTSHHLAISGLHVAVLGGLVWWVCRLLCVPPRWSAWVMLAFVVFYGLVALPSPPVIRSVVLCAAFGLGLLTRRATDAVQLLAISVFVMLIAQPLDLYRPGFQLSFITVAGLMLFTDRTTKLLGWGADPDLLVAQRINPPSPLEHVRRWLDRSLLTAIAAGIVAWLVSMPIVAYHFGQVNPWAIFASLVLALFVLASLVAGLIKVVLTFLWPALAPSWADLATYPVAAMRWVLDKLASLPGGDLPTPAPPWWLIALCFLLLLAVLRPWRRKSARVLVGAFGVLCYASVLILPLRTFIARHSPLGNDELRVTLLAVGAGQCAVVEPPSGRTVLLDAGSGSLTDLLAKCLSPYLRTRGITDVDTVVISHANYDHFSGVAALVEGWDVREVLAADGFTAQCAGNGPAESMLGTLSRRQRPPRTVSPGERIPLGTDTAIEILWPPKGAAANLAANDASLVLRLTHAGRTILFTGDVEDDGMRGLLSLPPDRLRADVLVAPHHGSAESLTDELIEAVRPTTIISSNDRTLTQKQRDFDEIAADLNRPLHRTHRRGAITVIVDGDGKLRVETFLDERGQPVK